VRRRARKVSFFGLFTDLKWNLALVFLLIPGARRSQNQSIRTADALFRSVTASPAELGAGALDALAIGTLGEYLPGFLGLVSLSSRS
jgi:hypothetical protein